jgi:hypothetical protein
MSKYLVLYRAPSSAKERMAAMTPAQQKAGMDAWMAWSKKAGSGIVDLGAPVGASVALGAKASPPDVGGFSILQADSLDAARKLCDGHPHLETPGGTIEILEHVSMNGM